MNTEKFVVILVHSTSHAIKAERVLKKSDIKCKLIPVPRQLSSDCGLCIQINANDIESAKGRLLAENVEIDQVSKI
ncbi:DUF3343 domain-containing protein [candidate division KSB1 bacterium]|nr:DUF3343 domain-containing protein [candidate division KSB1 bacterium]